MVSTSLMPQTNSLQSTHPRQELLKVIAAGAQGFVFDDLKAALDDTHRDIGYNINALIVDVVAECEEASDVIRSLDYAIQQLKNARDAVRKHVNG